jgi:hypothetical protein
MKTVLITLIVFAAVLCSYKPVKAQNLLTDGDFTSTTSIIPIGAPPLPLNTWCSWVNNATVTSFTPAITAGVCSFHFVNSSNISWEVQLNQFGFPLSWGRHYRLTFDVKAGAPRNFSVYIGEEGGLWTNLNTTGYLQQATASWQTKVIEFDAWEVFALHKLSFEMGAENIPMFFDNIKLEDNGPGRIPAIEIIGSSIPPDYWITGVDMPTIDGITYRLLNYTLPAGEVKFRQDQSWGINWGASSFPQGIGTRGGPNIPVTAGTYNIYFNRQTGAYRFDCVGCDYSIGIIGSSVPPYNWQVDVNMLSSDGIV